MTTTIPYSHSSSVNPWPSNVHDEVQTLYRKSEHLHRLAHSFAVTGNDRVADDLFGVSETLEGVAKAISDHVSNHIDQSLKDVQQSSATMLRACLAGVVVGKQSNKA